MSRTTPKVSSCMTALPTSPHNASALWVSVTSPETVTSAYLASKHANHFPHNTLPSNTNSNAYTLIFVQSHQNHLVTANTLLPLSISSLAMSGFTLFPTRLHRLSTRFLNLGLHLFKINQAALSSTSVPTKELNTPERPSELSLHSSLTMELHMRPPHLPLPPQTVSQNA